MLCLTLNSNLKFRSHSLPLLPHYTQINNQHCQNIYNRAFETRCRRFVNAITLIVYFRYCQYSVATYNPTYMNNN